MNNWKIRIVANELFANLSKVYKGKLSTILIEASEEEIDLIKKLLVYNPTKRITVENALKHPYLK